MGDKMGTAYQQFIAKGKGKTSAKSGVSDVSTSEIKPI